MKLKHILKRFAPLPDAKATPSSSVSKAGTTTTAGLAARDTRSRNSGLQRQS